MRKEILSHSTDWDAGIGKAGLGKGLIPGQEFGQGWEVAGVGLGVWAEEDQEPGTFVGSGFLANDDRFRGGFAALHQVTDRLAEFDAELVELRLDFEAVAEEPLDREQVGTGIRFDEAQGGRRGVSRINAGDSR